MGGKITAFVITLCCVCIIAGCVVIPLPPGQRVYITENDIKELLDNTAGRDKVINKLGHPQRQYESDISYRACRKGAGAFWAIIIPVPVDSPPGIDGAYRGDTKCYELILHFDNDDRLVSYEKHILEPPFTSHFKTPHGDLLPYIHSMAEKGIPESQWRLYNEYGRKREDIIWLCRSADNGYGKAQLHVGNLYWSAADIAQNKIKAYVWYKLAATGDMLQGLLPDTNTQIHAKTILQDAENSLTPEQLAEALILYANWKLEQCQSDLMPAIHEN